MKPHKPTAKSKATGLARARMLMKSKLWWLGGYPDGNKWVVVPFEGERGVEVLTLDRQHLRRATYAATKLYREFPRALPVLVGDSKTWFEAVRGFLNLFKPWVHSDESPPQNLFATANYPEPIRDLATRIANEQPKLQRFLSALSWVLYTRQEDVQRYLRWVSQNADSLSTAMVNLPHDKGPAFGIRLSHLAVTLGTRYVTPLVKLIGTPHLYEYPIRNEEYFAAQLADNRFPKKTNDPSLSNNIPEPHLPALLQQWTGWLLSNDPPTQRRFLSLLDLCDLPPLIESWALWWPKATRKVEKARNLLRGYEYDRTKEKQLNKIPVQMDQLRRNSPGSLHLKSFTESLQEFSTSSKQDRFKAARRALSHINSENDVVLRSCFLIHWWLLGKTATRLEEKKVPDLISKFALYLRQTGGDSASLAPWIDSVKREGVHDYHQYSMDDDLIDTKIKRENVGRFFQSLAIFHSEHPEQVTEDMAERILELIEVVPAAEQSSYLALKLYEGGQHKSSHSGTVLKAALRCSGSEAAVFSDLVQVFTQIAAQTELLPDKAVDVLLPVFGDDQELLVSLLLEKNLQKVIQCTRKLATLDALELPLKVQPRLKPVDARWIEAYPEQLHSSMKRLSRATPDAQAIARQQFRSVWHDFQSMRQEYAALRKIILTADDAERLRLEKRLVTLETRLASAQKIPAAKIQRLNQKVLRKAGMKLLELVELQADQNLARAIPRFFGLSNTPRWLLSDQNLRLLAPIAKLPRNSRNLAKRLIQIRSGPSPWDLRDHPANRKFLNSLEKSGIDWLFWTDGIGAVKWEVKKTCILLTLEDDPLVVLYMGGYFKTCLSPGSFNFHSAVSNAVDINKRVLYARDENGKVVGRRLLCLTREGRIILFHVYCHDKSLEFEKASDDFAHTLANKMGTRVVGKGEVPKLVARSWYNDGPVDTAAQFDFLEDGSPFRIQLHTVETDQLPALLSKVLGDSKIDEIVTPMLLSLPEFDSRPELIMGVLPHIRNRSRLQGDICLRAALLLDKAGAGETGAVLFGAQIEHLLIQWEKDHAWMDFNAISFLCRTRPSQALRILRRTRRRRVKSWDEETTDVRLVAAAICMERLRRPSQAVKLYRLTIDRYRSGVAEQYARKRLKELER
jgi:hypothetical protein